MTNRIFHIARADDWEAARAAGRYAPASLASEGFVHASTAEQVPGTARRYYAGQRDLVLLELDVTRLNDLRWEDVLDRGAYPHVYEAIPLDAVVSARPFDSDASGVG